MWEPSCHDKHSDIHKRLQEAERRTELAIRKSLPNAGVVQRFVWASHPALSGTKRAVPVEEKTAPEQAPPTPVPEKKRKVHPAIRSIVGQQEGIAKFTTFMKQFSDGDEIPKWPIAMIHGKCGIGKTSSCYAMCKDYGFTVVEVNASDVRSYAEITDFLVKTGFGSTFSGKTALLFDEIDGAFHSERNSIKAIVDFQIRYKAVRNRAPILCTCNDASDSVLASLDPFIWKITFHKLFTSDMALLAKKLAKRKVPTLTLEKFVEQADGDVRQLELFISMYLMDSNDNMCTKDPTDNIFDTCKCMLLCKEPNDDITERFQSRAYYGAGLIHANYSVCIKPSDIESLSDFAEQMSDYDVLPKEHSSSYIAQAVANLVSRPGHKALHPHKMICKPDGHYFLPMSHKMRRSRFGQVSDILDSHFVKDNGLVV